MRGSLGLVLSVSLVVSVVCYPDPDVTTNCSCTGYPAVPCSAPSNTVTLDLSHNHMEKIPAGCFPNLPKLQRLLLQFNSISSVNPNAFQHNPVLEYLDISHNLLPQISALPFTSLPALTYLDISNNLYENMIMEESFDPKNNLQSLKVGNSLGVTIRRDSIKRAMSLRVKHIHLIASKMEYEPSSLTVLKHMEMTAVDTDYSTDLAKFLIMLIDICNNTDGLTLMKVDLRKTNLIFPVHDLLQKTTISKLVVKDLLVTGTYCKFLPFFLQSSLEEVYLENVVGEGKCNLTMGTFDRCRIRKFSINGVTKDFLQFFPQLTIAKLMACLTDVSVVNIGTEYFPCEFSVAMINLKTLNVSINELTEERLLSPCLSPFPKLQSLAIDHNRFQHLAFLGNKTAHMKDLVNLSVSYNYIQLKPQTVFINWTKSLRRLNLRSNQLTDEALHFLPKTLVMLDVSYNDIHSVSNLQSMTDLQELFLSGNKIMTLQHVLFPSSLRLLHVDRNNMSTISVATIRSLSLTELDFSGNPLHCDCDTLELAQFCRDSSKTDILGWPSGYRCQSPDSLNKTLEQISLPWPSCHEGPFTLILICCICIAIICFLIYKKHHGHIPCFSRRTSYSAVSGSNFSL